MEILGHTIVRDTVTGEIKFLGDNAKYRYLKEQAKLEYPASQREHEILEDVGR